MTQQEHDARSLALHRLVCGLIRERPGLLDRARATLARWESLDTPRQDEATARWRSLLTRGELDELVRAATDPSERGQQLRQSSPLATLLTPRERWSFLDGWKASRGA